MLNRIGLDAMVYGNHEFDLGPEPLAKFIEAADFPVLSGSVDVSADNLLAPLADDHLVLDVGGEKVAILGATTPDTAEISTPGPTVELPRPGRLPAPARWRRCEAEGVDKIILLSHLGDAGDVGGRRGGARASTRIVGGHSHTLFSNTDRGRALQVSADGRPAPTARAVPIVQAGAYSKYLGHLTLDLRRRRRRHRGHRRHQAPRRQRHPRPGDPRRGSRSSPARSRS